MPLIYGKASCPICRVGQGEQEQRTHSSQLAAGLVSAFDKINILTSGDSSRLVAGSFNHYSVAQFPTFS
jgi:hypothetical protein